MSEKPIPERWRDDYESYDRLFESRERLAIEELGAAEAQVETLTAELQALQKTLGQILDPNVYGGPAGEVIEPLPQRPLSLSDWVTERRENCLRIAAGKTGEDRESWIEDAHYFAELTVLATAALREVNRE